MARSLNVPGSPSAPLTTTMEGSTGERFSTTVRHFLPVGKPAPPRPRRPEASTSATMASGLRRRAASSPAPPPLSRYSSRVSMGCGKSTRWTNVMGRVLPRRQAPCGRLGR